MQACGNRTRPVFVQKKPRSTWGEAPWGSTDKRNYSD